MFRAEGLSLWKSSLCLIFFTDVFINSLPLDGVNLHNLLTHLSKKPFKKKITTKPRHNAQQLDNLKNCFNNMDEMGISLVNIGCADIHSGSKKLILGVFFFLFFSFFFFFFFIFSFLCLVFVFDLLVFLDFFLFVCFCFCFCFSPFSLLYSNSYLLTVVMELDSSFRDWKVYKGRRQNQS